MQEIYDLVEATINEANEKGLPLAQGMRDALDNLSARLPGEIRDIYRHWGELGKLNI